MIWWLAQLSRRYRLLDTSEQSLKSHRQPDHKNHPSQSPACLEPGLFPGYIWAARTLRRVNPTPTTVQLPDILGWEKGLIYGTEPYKLSTVQTGMSVGPVLSHTGNHTCSAITFFLMTELHSRTLNSLVSS